MNKSARFAEIWREATEEGERRAEEAMPNPMVVSNPQTKQNWYVREGLCGFAWVKIRPATCSFARWLKKNGIVSYVSYSGGYDIWCKIGGQSVERKEAWAQGVEEVLEKYQEELGCKGIYAQSRLD